MQDQVKVGEIINGVARRDAIHIAVAPVVAGGNLEPGWWVKVDGNGVAYYSSNPDEAVGIVDPFLTSYVELGKRFYVLLKPNTVTGMRHHWTHPAFKEKDQ